MFSARRFNGLCGSALLLPTLACSNGKGLSEETTIACVKMTAVYMIRKIKGRFGLQSALHTRMEQT